jgi:hypothetical protein
MTETSLTGPDQKRYGDYGFYAPRVMLGLSFAGLGVLVLNILAFTLLQESLLWLGRVVGALLLFAFCGECYKPHISSGACGSGASASVNACWI